MICVNLQSGREKTEKHKAQGKHIKVHGLQHVGFGKGNGAMNAVKTEINV